MKHFVLSLLSILIVFSAQAQLNITGEIRPRAEYRNGYRTLPDTLLPAYLVSQRTRLGFDYKLESIRFFVSLQDVRLWGEQKQRTHEPGIGINEAWTEIALNSFWSLKAGRQALVYDNGRLFSNNNWIHQGQFHDALMIKFSKAGYKADLIAAFNQKNERLFGTDYSNHAPNYKTLNALHLSKKFDKLNISLLGAIDGFQKDNTENTTYLRGTYGTFLTYDILKKLKLQLSAYYQNGKTKTGMPIEAYYHNAELTYTLNRFKFGGGYDFFSGTNTADTINTTFNTFDALYGVGHRFNGYMDYFTNIPLHTKNAGLINPYLTINYHINENFAARLDYHYFNLQNKLLSNGNPVDKYLGSELDFTFKYKINNHAFLDFGYFILFPTASMEVLKGGNKDKRAEYAFVMLTVKPSLFSEKSN